MTQRPYLNVRIYTWKAPDRTLTPGIGLFRGRDIQGHLTYAEAIELSNRLVDLAETLEQENPS